MRPKGQVWAETVIYTLIGLTLIGIVLAIVMPKINESRDRIVVEQSIESLNLFDEKINEVLNRGSGNVRRISSFSMRRGEFFVNSSADELTLLIDELSAPYSEPGVEIEIGRVKIFTEEGRRESVVRLTLDYSEIADIRFENSQEVRKFTSATKPYSFTIENEGRDGDLTVVDISEISGG